MNSTNSENTKITIEVPRRGENERSSNAGRAQTTIEPGALQKLISGVLGALPPKPRIGK